MHAIIEPQPISGRVTAPPSKSHTIRAFAAALLADGVSSIADPLQSADTEQSIAACRALGGTVEAQAGGGYTVRGIGGDLQRQREERGRQRVVAGGDGDAVLIDVGNSGTTLRLFTAIAALLLRPVYFDGDAQLRARPMGALLQSLTDLGAVVTPSVMPSAPPVVGVLPADSQDAPSAADAPAILAAGRQGYAPFTIIGPMTGGKTRIACPTSQYLSALLFSAPCTEHDTVIDVTRLEERPYVALTLQWLRRCGVRYQCAHALHYQIPGRQCYQPFDYRVEGDYSSATFMLCAAVLSGLGVEIGNLSRQSLQGDRRVVEVLRAMGAEIFVHENRLRIPRQQSAAGTSDRRTLRGGRFDLNDIPDALPALMACACYATQTVMFRNVAHARIKETDRIAVMSNELRKMGAKITEHADGVTLRPAPLHGARLHGHGDHRVVMALSIAALAANGRSVISDAEVVAVTYPNFFHDLSRLMRKKVKLLS